MEWKETVPRAGDLIRTKVTFYYHYGIFVTEDRVIQFGLPDAVERPAEDIRVLATDIDTFLHGGELEVAHPSREERKTWRCADEIVARAEARLGEGGYHILHNNCEHFAMACVSGEPTSSFLQELRETLRQKLGKEKHT